MILVYKILEREKPEQISGCHGKRELNAEGNKQNFRYGDTVVITQPYTFI